MSKNFEEEYRQMIDSEIPDLWDRIEARLPEMTAPFDKEADAPEKKTVIRAIFNRRNTAAAIMAAAAVFCVLAVRPAYVQHKNAIDEETYAADDGESGYHGSGKEGQSDSGKKLGNFLKEQLQGADKAVSSAGSSGNMTASVAMAENCEDAQSADSVSSSASATAQPDLAAEAERNEKTDIASSNDMAGETWTDVRMVEDAQKAAEEYYRQTVFEVVSMELETATEQQIIFRVRCNRDGQPVEPDRTVEVSFDGERWTVTNEGY